MAANPSELQIGQSAGKPQSAASKLVERGGQLFAERKAATTLWQEIAENFYPQRADFTLTRYIGEEFAEHLYSSYPLMVHRDLSNAFATMLRPRAKEWFQMTVAEDEHHLSKEAKTWLEHKTMTMRSAMYDRRTHFVRATTEGDADFAAFGQCCIQREINWNAAAPHLLYRTWHLRDVAWAEGYDQSVSEIYVRWKPRIQELFDKFGSDALAATMQRSTSAQKMMRHQCMRLCIASEIYPGQFGQLQGYPWVVVILDTVNMHIIAEFGQHSHGFLLPRWQTVSGSQYAYSPATVAGLPDARLLQAMSLTLLEAGEISVRPPMVATQDAVRSDIQLYAGGITWADSEYDERKGDVLRPITQDRRGLPMGYEVHDQQKAMLAEAFYINRLTLPPPEGDMTAFEVGQRVEEYVRAALPLFEPMEQEYNGALCEDTFDALLRAGAFGPDQEIPRELRGRDVTFKFTSPLHDAIERKNASAFVESTELIQLAMQLDPDQAAHMNVTTALHDALTGIGLKAEHHRTHEEMMKIKAEKQAENQAAAALEAAEQGGRAARDLAQAEQAVPGMVSNQM